MNPEHWEDVKQIVDACVDLDPRAREAHLNTACATDPALRAEVESLLAAYDEADDFMGTSILESTPHLLATGERVGAYELRELIGEGGMGAVYRAVRLSDFQKQVAVKVVKRGMDTEAILRRFRHERQILARLEHPLIARLIDGGATDDGRPYLVMEYIEGTPITDYCVREKLSVRARLELFRTVATAVQYAHQNLIVHRDLKPGNILVTADGTPKLLDFGIAKLLEPEPDVTMTAVRMMTPECASPEQVRGEPVTTASDIYALGVLLYQMLTGERPYRIVTRTVEEITRLVCNTEPAKPSAVSRSLSADLDNIVLKAMHKDASRRYNSVEQFSDDVRRYLAGLPVIARKDTFSYRASKFLRRHKTASIAALGVACSLVGGMATTLWEAHIARIERARAQARFDDVRKLSNSILFEIHDAIAELPGATAARALLVKRAAEYLDRLAQNAGNDDALRRELATAYTRLGAVEGRQGSSSLGDTATATASYRKAVALMEQVVAAHPTSIPDRHWLAINYDRLGELLGVDNGAEYGLKARKLREGMAAQLPPAQLGNELAYSDYHTAKRRIAKGDTAGSLESMTKALAGWQKFADAKPDDVWRRQPVALAQKHIGGLLMLQRRYAEALEHYRAAEVIDEALLRENPTSVSARLDLTFTQSDIGGIQLRQGDWRAALAAYRKALAVREEIATADPKNDRAQSSVAVTYYKVASILLDHGQPQEAADLYRKAIRVREKLVANPALNENQDGLAYDYYGLANALRRMAERAHTPDAWRAARSAYQRAFDIWNGLRARGVKDVWTDDTEHWLKVCDETLARLGG